MMKKETAEIKPGTKASTSTPVRSPSPAPAPPSGGSTASPPPPRSRTVNDYPNEGKLRMALLSLDQNSVPEKSSSSRRRVICEENRDDIEINANWDWALENYDVQNTEPQTISDEISRLQVLKSYHILDVDREPAFEKITSFTARVFDVPICLISLVDVGRQWFLSNLGLGDVRETPRKLAFCAHAIQSRKHGVFIVTDTLEDFRFRDSLLVTGPPHIRFYAGAPLLAPEGYKLGTLCVIDSKPRPSGLTEEECNTLTDMAALAVRTFVDRRKLRTTELAGSSNHMTACAAHDLLTPLNGLHLTLSLLEDDLEVQTKLCGHSKKLVRNATRGVDAMLRICKSSSLGSPKSKNSREDGKGGKGERTNNVPGGGTKVSSSSSSEFNNNNGHCCVAMKEFCESIELMMDPLPRRVPCVISIDKSVPCKIITDELKILRCSLNLLSYACAVSETESIQFRIFPEKNGIQQLVFECEDTGKDIQQKDQVSLFKALSSDSKSHYNFIDLGLVSIASQIDALGGKYGFRPRSSSSGSNNDVCGGSANANNNNNGHSSATKTSKNNNNNKSGSIFWFSVPIVLPPPSSSLVCGRKRVLPLQKTIVHKMRARDDYTKSSAADCNRRDDSYIIRGGKKFRYII